MMVKILLVDIERDLEIMFWCNFRDILIRQPDIDLILSDINMPGLAWINELIHWLGGKIYVKSQISDEANQHDTLFQLEFPVQMADDYVEAGALKSAYPVLDLPLLTTIQDAGNDAVRDKTPLLHERYRRQLVFPNAAIRSETVQNQILRCLYQLVHQRDSALSVEWLGEKLAMSRKSL